MKDNRDVRFLLGSNSNAEFSNESIIKNKNKNKIIKILIAVEILNNLLTAYISFLFNNNVRKQIINNMLVVIKVGNMSSVGRKKLYKNILTKLFTIEIKHNEKIDIYSVILTLTFENNKGYKKYNKK